MRYPQGTNVYAADQYDKSSNATYHYVLGPKIEAVKSASVAQDSRVKGGDILTYTVTVRNTGEDKATNLLVCDTLSNAVRYAEGSQTSSRSDARFVQEAGTIGWIIPELAIGETVVFTFRVRVEDMAAVGARTIANTAWAGEAKMGADARTELFTADYLKPSNEVRVFQYVGVKITVRKIDASTGQALGGAEFILRSANGSAGDLVAVSDRNGQAVFEDVPQGKYLVIESAAPEGYIASDVRRSLDMTLGQTERTIIVPNRRGSGMSSQTDFGDNDELERNWGALLELIMDLGVPNAGAGSRNVGDSPK